RAAPLRDRVRMRGAVGEGVRGDRHERHQRVVLGPGTVSGRAARQQLAVDEHEHLRSDLIRSAELRKQLWFRGWRILRRGRRRRRRRGLVKKDWTLSGAASNLHYSTHLRP